MKTLAYALLLLAAVLVVWGSVTHSAALTVVGATVGCVGAVLVLRRRGD